MKKIYLPFVFFVFFIANANCQTPTWSDDIAQLVYDKCGDCHHQGGLAPFSLLSYQDAFSMRTAMQTNVNSGYMPPWPPDDSYQEYAHKRSLTSSQIQMINDWVNGGAPEGTAANTPTPPTYNQGSFLGTPDLQLDAPVYASKATASSDDYVCFSIPTNINVNKRIKAIEVIPGNPQIVHHCLVYADQTGTVATDTSGNCGGPTTSDLLAGYAPGEFPTIFPNGNGVKMGAELNVGSNIVLAMHYPNGSTGMVDSTKVNIFFYDDTVSNVRIVDANPILQNWSFCFNPNTVTTISNTFPSGGGIPTNYSLLSVFPHAHLLGQNFTVYAITNVNDTIPIIRIPKWDFEWQGFYLFKNPIKLPIGSRLYGEGDYDNTVNNPNNPNQPPATVCAGLNTTDEMFLVYFQYLPYQTGDEFLDLDSLTQPPNQGGNPTAMQNQATGSNYLLAYPNPFDQQVNIEYYVKEMEEVSLQVYDIQGRLVSNVLTGEQQQGRQQVAWQGQNDAGQDLNAGLYLLYLKVGDQVTTQKVMLRR